MIIAIAGIKRSGSTVQYNLVRIALEMAGYKVNICGHDYRPRIVPEGEVDLVKRHKFSEEIAEAADYIFLTDRKDSEIIESLTRFNGKEPQEGRIADMRKHLNMWMGYKPNHCFDYSLWQDNSFMYVEDIVNILCLPVDSNHVLKAFNEIEPPESGQDSKTLMFHNHRTSKND